MDLPGFLAVDEKTANINGATCIRNQLTALQHDLSLDGLGLDFYHLAENVHSSRRIVYGEDSAIAGRKFCFTRSNTRAMKPNRHSYSRVVTRCEAKNGRKRIC